MLRLLAVLLVAGGIVSLLSLTGDGGQDPKPSPQSAAVVEENERQVAAPSALQEPKPQRTTTNQQAGSAKTNPQSTAQNKPPVADAGKDLRFGLDGGLVVLSGSDSFDPDGQKLTFTWEQAFGPEVQLMTVESSPSDVTFEGLGRRVLLGFVLTVTDPNGAADTARVHIAFDEEPAPVEESTAIEETASKSNEAQAAAAPATGDVDSEHPKAVRARAAKATVLDLPNGEHLWAAIEYVYERSGLLLPFDCMLEGAGVTSTEISDFVDSMRVATGGALELLRRNVSLGEDFVAIGVDRSSNVVLAVDAGAWDSSVVTFSCEIPVPIS